MVLAPALPDSARSKGRAWVEFLLVALLYYLSSRLTLAFVPAIGHAAAVWPASGIVLAAVLLIGPRIGPGIVVGSFAVALETSLGLEGGPSLLVSILMSLAIALGSALQAVVGGFSVRRLAGYPNTLANESDVLRFLVLGGPVSSLIRPSIGVASLSLFGAISREDLLFTFGMWWVGDTLGTALFAPLLLLWCDGAVTVRWRRKVSVSAPLLLTLAATIVLFGQVGARERDRSAIDFERRTEELAYRLRRSFDGSLDRLESLGGFCDAAERIDRRQFGTFARNTLSLGGAVRAISWIPRVKHSERGGCITAGRLEIDPSFDLVERGPDGAWESAAERPEYAPTFYLEPPDHAAWKLGSDAAADPVHREALLRARDSAEPIATPSIPIGTGAGQQFGFFVYRPVYGRGEDRDSVAARRTSLAGYATGLFLVSDLVEEGLSGTPIGEFGVELFDVTGDGEKRRIYSKSLRDSSSGVESNHTERAETTRTSRLSVAGRDWDLRFARSVAIVNRSWQAWIVLVGGLLFTGLLGAFLLVVTGRADAIEELVARRMKEIERVNASLRHEIAERVRAEAQHHESEERLTAAQQIAHLGSWELDLGTNRFLWSEELHRIHGQPRDDVEIDFETFLARVHPDDQELVDLTFGQAGRDYRPFRLRYRIVLPDGMTRTLDGRGEVTLDGSGNPIRMHGTGQDITELEAAEKELADRTVELDRTNAELERFAYVASHDLQEPLRAVASHVQILQQDYQGKLGAEADECIQCAVEGARRMRDLINDYLAYSRVRTGVEPHQMTSSSEALEQALRDLGDLLASSEARVTHEPLPDVVADPAQLTELFKNLVTNAIKFHGDKPPRVRIHAARADKAWVFSVQDNGIGIDPEYTGRIFRLFQRLHTQDRYPGTGIGLAICKKIVERHGGRIWVESMPGMGSTFHFTLSAHPEEKVAEAPDWRASVALASIPTIDSGDCR